MTGTPATDSAVEAPAVPNRQQQRPTTTTVVVTNISPRANEKTIVDFFSFCGKITNLVLNYHEGIASDALVTFETEAAAKTALLLTNALIIDRPIAVVLADPTTPPPTSTPTLTQSTVLSGDQIENRPPVHPVPENSVSHAIASIVAAGYILGADAANKAHEIDEQNQLSSRLQATVTQLDQDYHISETFDSLAAKISQTAKEVDTKYQISEKTSSMSAAASQTWNQGIVTIQAKIQETPSLANALSRFNQWREEVNNNYIQPTAAKIQAEVDSIQRQSEVMIQQKQMERGELSPVEPSVPSLDGLDSINDLNTPALEAGDISMGQAPADDVSFVVMDNQTPVQNG